MAHKNQGVPRPHPARKNQAPDDRRRQIADILYQARLEKNLTQPMLAERLGVVVAAVSLWERGLREPDTRNFLKLAQFYDLDPWWLVEGIAVAVRREYWLPGEVGP